MLSPDDFAAFFEEVHGCDPFPWQRRLLRRVAIEGKWPDTLELPTGSGKTAAIDIAVFHLALEAEREQRRAPVRIAFVVDRRLVVDDAFERAKKLARMLDERKGSVTARVADRLTTLSGDGPALIARRLRGGIPREDDWARTPSQPTVLCSTVDQIGSRLLFRGYGVSDPMKPVHAGLIGSDCLILLDEAHLAEPFRQTLAWVQMYQGQNWRQVDNVAAWGVAFLTATPGKEPGDNFSLDGEDRAHLVLKRRLNASKPARLTRSSKSKTKDEDAPETEDDETDRREENLSGRAEAIEQEVRCALEHFKKADNGAQAPAIGVVVNRVARARAVFEHLKGKFKEQIANGAVSEPVLMIGPARSLDRDELVKVLDPIRTRTWNDGERRTLDKSLIVVATQCIEAGVDIDLDALITEAAPLDSLRQRFGRLNRAGRDITPYGAVIVVKSDVSARNDDPVYGRAIKAAWAYLAEKPDRKEDDVSIVDFGLNAFSARMATAPVPREALSPKDDAPILLPAHLDLLSQTSPIPAADPDIALYLHGPNRQPDSITVVWRADIDSETDRDEHTRRLLIIVPPRASETVELPLWAVRRWLTKSGEPTALLADVAAAVPEEEDRLRRREERRRVFRWKGDDDRSRWISPSELRPGDTIIVPATYGGADEFGWNPYSEKQVTDVARKAAEPFAGRRFAVRVARGLLGGSVSDDVLADALAGAPSQGWQDLRAALLDLDLPEATRTDLDALDHARGSVLAYLDLYGNNAGRPRGVVFAAPFGITAKMQDEDGQPNATEDDASGSMPGFQLALEEHCRDVENKAEAFANAAGLPAARVADLKLAGRLHDAGKADPRFQAWLHYGDPLGADPDHLLAKSGRQLPRAAREESRLPERWRHEACSVRLTLTNRRISQAKDPELMLWLIGTHHGHGRPLFPHRDLTEEVPDVGPQSLAFDWKGLDWPTLFGRLKARYGIWELARMEAILRLADHRASEERAAKEDRR